MCVCVCVCVCGFVCVRMCVRMYVYGVRACMYSLRIVSTDKILRFLNTLTTIIHYHY